MKKQIVFNFIIITWLLALSIVPFVKTEEKIKPNRPSLESIFKNTIENKNQ